jgi:hypothetical protein
MGKEARASFPQLDLGRECFVGANICNQSKSLFDTIKLDRLKGRLSLKMLFPTESKYD